MCGSHRPFVVALVLLTWLTFIMYAVATILSETDFVTVVSSQSEGLVIQKKETRKSENTLIKKVQGMSHEELVNEMVEMKKELKSQNERLEFQGERINQQDKKILVLESSHLRNSEINKEKSAFDPIYIDSSFSNKKQTNYIIEREKRGVVSSNSSSSIGSKYIKMPPRLCTSLFDPDHPDSVIPIREKFTREPSSCYDLRLIGHYLNGFYSVKTDGKTETIFCNFSEPTVEISKKVSRNGRLCTSLYNPEHPDATFPIKRNFTGEPTNCLDLQLIGHYLNGYYSVKNGNGNIGTIFCNFNEHLKAGVSKNDESPTAKTIVTTDIKSGPLSSSDGVHFFVQRNRPWSTEGAISFQIEKLNIGGAIDVSTGIFTTPRNGVYHFAFSGMMQSGTGKLFILLRRNINETIAVAHGDVGVNVTFSPMISFSATVRLQKDDMIDLYKEKNYGVLYDSRYYPYTSYTGSLLMG